MVRLEFWTRLGPDRTLSVPPEVAAQIEGDEPVRVVLILPDADEDRAWSELTTDQFLRDDDAGDELYDQLPTG